MQVMVITFDAPLQRISDVENNPYTTGRYVIMAIKHMVNVEAQRHEMVLNVKKIVLGHIRMRRMALTQIDNGKDYINEEIYKIQRDRQRFKKSASRCLAINEIMRKQQ